MELVKTEKKEHSIVQFTIAYTKDEVETAKNKAYKKNGKNISVPGFRKGKAPRFLIEKMYGDIFLEEAANILNRDSLNKAIEEAGVTPVGQATYVQDESSEPGALTIIASVPVMPDVEISQYKGLEVEKPIIDVSDDDVEAELKRMAQNNGRTVAVDRESRIGDSLDINFEGLLDGVPFENGSAENFQIILGSKMFVPGFEDQLLRCKAGDEKDVFIKFPDDYGEASLAGKDVVFKCKVNRVDETILPELDDEFAKDVSETCDTLDELKEEVRKNMISQREEAAERTFEDNVIKVLCEHATVDLPDAMIDAQAQHEIQQFAYQMQSKGLSLEEYCKKTNTTVENLSNAFRVNAEVGVRNRLVLEKVAEMESITVDEQEIEDEYNKAAEQYNIGIDVVKKSIPKEPLIEDLKVAKALELVKNEAVVKSPAPASETQNTEG